MNQILMSLGMRRQLLIYCTMVIMLFSYSNCCIAQENICAFAVNRNSNDISRYSLNALTGQLTSMGSPTQSGGYYPSDSGSYGNNHYLYVVNEFSNTISLFSIEHSDCSLKLLKKITTGIQPKVLAFDSQQKFAYIPNMGDNTISQYAVDKSTGMFKPLTPATVQAKGTTIYSIVIDPSDKFAFVVYKSEAAIASFRRLSDGNLEMVPNSKIDTGISPMDPVISSNRQILVASYLENSISRYTYDLNSGVLNPLDEIYSYGVMPITGVFYPDSQHFYLSNLGSWNITLFDINAITPDKNAHLVESGYAAGQPVFDSYGHAYITSSNENLVWMYKVESDFSLTPLPQATISSRVSPYFFVIADLNAPNL